MTKKKDIIPGKPQVPIAEIEESLGEKAEREFRASQEAQLERLFMYHAPGDEQIPRYRALRAAALEFARALIRNTRPGADQAASLRKIREALFTANASVALEGKGAGR